MEDKALELEAARAAKEKARVLFQDRAEVCGVGITRQAGRYAVRVNLQCDPPAETQWPEEIDGVPVVVQVTGPVRKQSE